MPSLVREGEIFAGKYSVERVLGEGAHGLVFAARNIELDELVAVKLLKRASADDATAERFLREARAAQKICGDGVARVFAVDQLDDGDLFMVMEYLEGHDLRHELRTSGKLEIFDAVECILQTCDVLGRAHAMGIIHRDIKSANLFSVKRNDGRRQIKLLDFGIARDARLALDRVVRGGCSRARRRRRSVAHGAGAPELRRDDVAAPRPRPRRLLTGVDARPHADQLRGAIGVSSQINSPFARPAGTACELQ